jgi:alpha-mannosidase
MQDLPNAPVWVGELYLELHRATFTSQHKTKQGNRRAEHLLVEAEMWAATAAVRTGAEYPHDELDALWKQVLLQQFHDILPGTSIAWVHREAIAQYARVTALAEALIGRSLASLLGEGLQTVAVNAAPFAHAGVPAGGAAVVEEESEKRSTAMRSQEGGYVLDNGVIRVVVSAEGLVTSAVDTATGRDAVPAGREACLLQLHQDLPNHWDAWDVDRYYRNRVTDLRDVSELRAEVTEYGVGRVVVERKITGDSTVRQALSLAPGSRMLEIEQVTDWHEVEKFLKVSFPLAIRAEHTVAETQFGHHKRVTHINTSWEAAKFETSMHRFVHVEERGFGVTLVNDSIYGYDVARDVVDAEVTTCVRLSLLRAPRYPDPETDQGRQTHRYGLVVGADLAAATREGFLLNTSFRQITGAHGFEPLVFVTGKGLVLSSVKASADRSGDIVVRVYESLGARTSGTLHLGFEASSVAVASLLEEPLDASPCEVHADGGVAMSLGAFEVRTLRLTPRPAVR